jgi:hypothetical protein
MRYRRVITVILSMPNGMLAEKAIVGLTIVLSAWFVLFERRRIRGPAWTAPA